VDPDLIARSQRKDLPDLGFTFSSTDPSVQIMPEKGELGREQMMWPAGNGVWWVNDVWANSSQEYAFLVHFPLKEGIYYLRAESYDLILGAISGDTVAVEIRREGGKVFAPSLGTPFPTATPWPTPMPTPTYPPPRRTPTPTQLPYPIISPISTPTPAAYP